MKNSALKRLLGYIKPYNKYLILAFISAIISVFFSLLSPILIGKAIDLAVEPSNVDYANIIKILIFLGLAVSFSSLFQWLMTRTTNVITYNTVKDLRVDAFNKLNRVPLKYIDGKIHGDIISSVINDISQISDGLIQGFSQLFTGIITIVGTIFFMLSINITITLVVIVLTPISLFVASFIAKHSNTKFTEQTQLRGKLTGYIEEMIGNQKLVKTFCYEDTALNEFKEINEDLASCGVLAQFYSALTNPSTRFVNGVVYAAVGTIGAISAIHGKISIGQISSFLSYANQYTKPFNDISGVFAQFQAAIASAERVFSIIDEQEEKEDAPDAIDIKHCAGNIDIKNVSFSYTRDKKLIENFNLSVKSGANVAIVGPTGCGKSTLINLLMRFYDIDSGDIEIDGVNIKNIKRKSSRKLFGMVLQDTWLYTASVRDNIAYGKPNATMDEIIEASKKAHAHEFIQKLPNGYDTILAGDGSNISQGQKQLLCIARIMLTDPCMLILDEATSNIDTRTEVYVQKAFNDMMKGHTSFIVAHRLSTIRDADLILVMRDGKIIEQGNHEELLKANGFYTNLYNSQFNVPSI